MRNFLKSLVFLSVFGWSCSSWGQSSSEIQWQPLDTPSLFSGGVLSPGYQQRRSAQGGEALEPVSSHREPYLVLLVNPALVAVGKWSFRAEIAPLPAHALFLEYSRLKIQVPEFPAAVRGQSFDIGYHLFPFGWHLNGLYLGPRYFFGDGKTDEAKGSLRGFGFDLGYQLAFGIFALNAGVGLGRALVQIERTIDIPEGVTVSVPEKEERRELVPLLTLAFGLAF
jgi:hypothetical protein